VEAQEYTCLDKGVQMKLLKVSATLENAAEAELLFNQFRFDLTFCRIGTEEIMGWNGHQSKLYYRVVGFSTKDYLEVKNKFNQVIEVEDTDEDFIKFMPVQEVEIEEPELEEAAI
jgi:hypothetical protein